MRYGDYEDDFDDYGSDRGFDRDADRDGGGAGFERDDEGSSALMTMTRRDSERDVRDLYNSSLADMRAFLRERETPEPEPISGVAVTLVEIGLGAAFAAYLQQRFRQAGALVPVGLTAGALMLAAAHYKKFGAFSGDARNISYGAIASAIALWAAGRGIINVEGVALGPGTPAGGTPVTAGVSAPAFTFAPPMMAPQPQPNVQRPPVQPQTYAYARPPMPAAQPTMGASFVPSSAMADFHNLVARVR